MFNRAETCLVVGATDHYHSRADTVAVAAGWERAGSTLSYNTLFQVQNTSFTHGLSYPQDIRDAIDDLHVGSLSLKHALLAEPGRFLHRDGRIAALLARISRTGSKSFLLTNSDWWFTDTILTFLLGGYYLDFFCS